MKVRRLTIENFRGVTSGQIDLGGDTLLVGGNNIGKSTVCEALDLVLGPERLNRRPVVDEHDFAQGQYADDEGKPIPIVIKATLTDLSDEALRRFGNHLRRWDEAAGSFIDEQPDAADHADDDGVVWALEVAFRARYDREEDDFEADTFFEHPIPDADELSDEGEASLGEGRIRFARSHKRLCGFVFLRTLRTGSRALGLQRGSLLDTVLRLSGEGVAEMWLDTLTRLRDLDPSVGDVEQLKDIRTEVRTRMGQFVNLAPGDDSTAFFASDLTREHLREVVRLFIATGPSDHPVPFSRQGTGSINLLVFALLTIIARLKGNKSVIFAMEEPEIALPPHTQRRVTRFVLKEMGQTIVTSHSPYVIEQFEPESIVMLDRAPDGELRGAPIDTRGLKPKTYRTERRQFAEAILARGVLVVEGPTEASLLPVVSSVLEEVRAGYTHLDLAGVSIFTAAGDGDVPRWGPVFKTLGKMAFGLIDKQLTRPTADAAAKLACYDKFWEAPKKGVEELLVDQIPTTVLRRFLDDVSTRSDYPVHQAPYTSADAADPELKGVALAALKARKGEAWGYAAMLIEKCQTEDELPDFLRDVLVEIDTAVVSVSDDEVLPEADDKEAMTPADDATKEAARPPDDEPASSEPPAAEEPAGA